MATSPNDSPLSIGAWFAAITAAAGALTYLVKLGQLLQEVHTVSDEIKSFKVFAEQSIADSAALHEDLADLRARHEALAERVREGR
jgi:hypothetical protein